MTSNPLRKLTRKSVSVKDAGVAMQTALFHADDRSAAITAASLTEFALEKAIRHRLRPLNSSERKALFEGVAPLATFSAKIRLGYALGMYGRETRHDLEAINAIRNVFAHTIHPVSFKSRAIVSRVYGMHSVLENHGGKRPRPLEARHDYLAATRMLWLQLVILVGHRVIGPPLPAFSASRKLRKRTRSIKQ